MLSQRGFLGVVVTLLGILVHVSADVETHIYTEKEPVVLWLNTVGPFHNPQETYPYHSLPFCKDTRDDGKRYKNSHGMGEVLEGNVLKDSGIQIQFGVDVPLTKLCSLKLDTKKADKFALAVRHHYWYQMYIDDLPLWAMVGQELTETGKAVSNDEYMAELEEHGAEHMELAHEKYKTEIFTMKTISIARNGNQIIEVNVTSDNPVSIQDDQEVQFAYSVTWIETDIPFDKRFDRYLDYDFFEHRIHWFSIINSFMMVIFLCGVVALILIRTLRNDFAKYTRDDDDLDSLDRGMGDESGWKQVHGDVFRPPPFISLFAALLGTGYQLAAIAGLVICLAAIGGSYEERGAITTSFIGCYAISSIIAGFTSGSYYSQCFYPQPSPNWIRTMMLTVLLLPGMVFGVMFFLNFVAVYFGTVSMMPIGTLLQLILIWACISFPLSVTGTILGRNWNGKTNYPCRIKKFPRAIPMVKWYLQPWFIIMATGVLPFGSIFIEMYYIFSSFWNYKFYYVYGFILLIYLILVVVSICVTIVSVYVLLNAEDYRWQWISFLGSGSTAFYVFLYSIYYYFAKTNMTGFLQTCYYFGYMSMACFAGFIM